jgi:hypothetical protein
MTSSPPSIDSADVLSIHTPLCGELTNQDTSQGSPIVLDRGSAEIQIRAVDGKQV